MSQNELYHFGVKGMKWGVRRSAARIEKLGQKRDRKIAQTKSYAKTDYNSFEPYTKTGIKSKNGKTIMTGDDVKKAQRENKAGYDKHISKLNTKYDKKIRREQNKQAVNQATTITDRMIYNEATRKRAVKLMTNNNMSLNDAISASKKTARNNSGLVIGLAASVAIADIMRRSL